MAVRQVVLRYEDCSYLILEQGLPPSQSQENAFRLDAAWGETELRAYHIRQQAATAGPNSSLYDGLPPVSCQLSVYVIRPAAAAAAVPGQLTAVLDSSKTSDSTNRVASMLRSFGSPLTRSLNSATDGAPTLSTRALHAQAWTSSVAALKDVVLGGRFLDAGTQTSNRPTPLISVVGTSTLDAQQRSMPAASTASLGMPGQSLTTDLKPEKLSAPLSASSILSSPSPAQPQQPPLQGKAAFPDMPGYILSMLPPDIVRLPADQEEMYRVRYRALVSPSIHQSVGRPVLPEWIRLLLCCRGLLHRRNF